MIRKMSKKADSKKWDVVRFIKRRTFRNPIKSKNLEIEFSLTGSEIRSIVHFARAKHHLPIASDSAGYFYA